MRKQIRRQVTSGALIIGAISFFFISPVVSVHRARRQVLDGRSLDDRQIAIDATAISADELVLPPARPRRTHLPVSVAVSAQGVIAIADSSNNCVYLFGPDRALRRTIVDHVNTGLNGPCEVAFDETHLYVLDAGDRPIKVYDHSGWALVSWRSWLVNGRRVRLREPRGLATGHGRVYVADTDNGRIVCLTPHGDCLGVWGEWGDAPGQFREPYDLTVLHDGTLLVVDRRRNAVQRFTADGTFLEALANDAQPCSHPAFSGPVAVASTLLGHWLVLEERASSLSQLTPDGHCLLAWQGAGLSGTTLDRPKDFALTDDGILVIADTGNRRVLILRTLSLVIP